MPVPEERCEHYREKMKDHIDSGLSTMSEKIERILIELAENNVLTKQLSKKIENTIHAKVFWVFVSIVTAVLGAMFSFYLTEHSAMLETLTELKTIIQLQ